jgi:hypothetical protein
MLPEARRLRELVVKALRVGRVQALQLTAIFSVAAAAAEQPLPVLPERPCLMAARVRLHQLQARLSLMPEAAAAVSALRVLPERAALEAAATVALLWRGRLALQIQAAAAAVAVLTVLLFLAALADPVS